MHIEKIKILTTLKTGKKVWGKGSIIEAPIPPELISEVRANTGLIEVLKPTTNKVNDKVKEEDNETSTPPEESSSSDTIAHGLTKLSGNMVEGGGQVHVFIAPEGDEIEIESIWQYSKETGMSYNGLNNLVKGRSKTHKGWTYKGLK